MAGSLIQKLGRAKNIVGTCPECGEHFRLASAVLFDACAKELPRAALAAVERARQHIADRKQALSDRKRRATDGTLKTTEAVNVGKQLERIVPSLPDFGHHVRDCRALYDPIDLLVFTGLSKGNVEALSFVDVKTGGAKLSPRQREIKRVVEQGRISWELEKAHHG